MSDLRCPYCGGKLTVHLETTGRAYMTYQVAEAIECDRWQCGAEWEPNGDLRTPGASKP